MESPTNTDNKRIHLQVGERRFITSTDILKGSGFFAAFTAERWESQTEEDGSYFVDADPEIFAHILRYLRHDILPIFYDREKGHDYPLYLAVEQQAEYFVIPRLLNWLRQKRYLSAITIDTSAELLTNEYDISGPKTADTVIEYHPAWKTDRVYVCPRGISSHRGNPRACGRQCRNAQGEGEAEYVQELVLTTLAIRRRTIFNSAVCVERD